MFGRWCIAALAAALAEGVAAQGYFEFGAIPGVGVAPTVQVDLNAEMLALVAVAASITDPAAAEALAGIDGVRADVYESVDDPQAVLRFIADSAARLEHDGWERTVLMQDGGQVVRVYSKLEGSRIVGLTVMLFGGQAVFVNVAGNIDPLQVAQILGVVGSSGLLASLGAIGLGAPD